MTKGDYLSAILGSRSLINKNIIENRSGLPINDLVKQCIIQLEKIDNRRILRGMGASLSPKQKDWARENLKDETITLLKLRI